MHPFLLLSGSELARRIRRGETTSREVVEIHIARLLKVNPVIRAVVGKRLDEARREADAADRLTRDLAPERLPPFLGVPCTIKECFAVDGMPQTGGLMARRGFVAHHDAPAVARLKGAGAIPLGITNVSELCMWMETHNRLYGRTNNPYDPRRIVGGSSGGEGAIVGAGGVPFGLGSDIGGSIRMPAFFNGVFGHKPTGGLIPVTGQFPLIDRGGRRYVTAGPIARRAEDLMPLVQVLAGPDPDDPESLAIPLGDPEGVDLGKMRVFVIPGDGLHPVTDDLLEAEVRAAEALRSLGASVKRVTIDPFRKSFEIWSSMLQAVGSTPFGTLLGNGRPIRPLWELVRWIVRRSDHTLPAIVLAGLEDLSKRFPGRIRRFVDAGVELRQRLVDLLGPHGVILYPPYPEPAPRHNRPMFGRFKWVYTAIFNAMQMPVTQVPLGLNGSGLPLGVQVAAIHGNDHVTIRVARELEKSLGGWVPPPLA